MQDFDQVMDCDVKEGKFEWFRNGKLNASGKNKLVGAIRKEIVIIQVSHALCR